MDAQVFGNDRGIKLFSHTMKLWERVIEKRIKQETVTRENQFGFIPKKSFTETIHVGRLMEKFRGKGNCKWCLLISRRRMIAYHVTSFGIA